MTPSFRPSDPATTELVARCERLFAETAELVSETRDSITKSREAVRRSQELRDRPSAVAGEQLPQPAADS
jgi:hypothetical protein